MAHLDSHLPSIRMNAWVVQALKFIAASDNRSLSYVVRLAVAEFLDRHPRGLLNEPEKTKGNWKCG